MNLYDLYAIALGVSDTIMTSGPNSSMVNQYKDSVVQLIDQLGLKQPETMNCETILSEVKGQIDETGKAVINLVTAMNFLRYHWKYNLPEPDRFRKQILDSYRTLNRPNAVEFFKGMLIPFENQPSFHGMMFLLQYISEGCVLALQDDGVSSFSIGQEEATNHFLGFVHCATTSLQDYRGQDNIPGDFVAAAETDWYVEVTKLGTPDLESGCLWAMYLEKILKGDDAAPFTIEATRQYPHLGRMLISYSLEAVKMVARKSHPTTITSIALKPFLWTIGASLT